MSLVGGAFWHVDLVEEMNLSILRLGCLLRRWKGKIQIRTCRHRRAPSGIQATAGLGDDPELYLGYGSIRTEDELVLSFKPSSLALSFDARTSLQVVFA